MSMNEFLENRKSVRDFKSKNLSDSDLKKVESIIFDINNLAKKYDVNFKLYKAGSVVYNSLDGEGGYDGTMIKANHYIAMEADKNNELSMIFGAFYFENLITKLDALNVGSCWVTISNASEESKKSAFGDNSNVDFLLAMGYAPNEFGFGKKKFSSRIGVEEFVCDKSLSTPIDIDKLQNYGLDELFSYLRFAPSTKNEQPWRFVLNDDDFDLYIKDYKGIENLIDAGIVMYYYTELANYNNIDANWIVKEELKDKDNCKYIASVNF